MWYKAQEQLELAREELTRRQRRLDDLEGRVRAVEIHNMDLRRQLAYDETDYKKGTDGR